MFFSRLELSLHALLERSVLAFAALIHPFLCRVSRSLNAGRRIWTEMPRPCNGFPLGREQRCCPFPGP